MTPRHARRRRRGFVWCCCAPPTCTVTICVKVVATACSSTTGVQGAGVVIIQGGVTVGTGTTDSTGNVCVVITTTSGGTYTVNVTAPVGAGLNNSSSSVTVACGATANVTVTCTVKSGWQCTDCCGDPVANSLTLTDGQGSATIAYSGSVWGNTCHSFTGKACGTTTACGGRTLLSPTSGTIGVLYTLECLGGGNWRLSLDWKYAEYWTACSVDPGTGAVTFSAPDYAYSAVFPCTAPTCSGLFNLHTVGMQVDIAGGGLVMNTCAPGAFALTATFPGSVFDSGSGLTVPNPVGTTVTISS